jgi:hypothetical protein
MITLHRNVCCLGSGTIARLLSVEHRLLACVAVVVVAQQLEWRLPLLAP